MIIVTPSVGDSWYVNSAADPKARYEDFIVRISCPTLTAMHEYFFTRDGRALAGISMGAWRDDARPEASSIVRRHRRHERPVSDLEAGSEDGHDVADAAAVWRTRHARAPRA